MPTLNDLNNKHMNCLFLCQRKFADHKLTSLCKEAYRLFSLFDLLRKLYFYCNHTMHLIQVQILVLHLNVKIFLILYFIPQGMDGSIFNLRFLRSSAF